MLKKIQRRFVLAAMAAFGTVMLLIIVGINAANYYRTTSMQDHLAEELLAHEQTARSKRAAPPPPVRDKERRDPEAAFTTRFFTVHCDADGRIGAVSRDFISSVDEETAKAYAQAALARGGEKGYYGTYRYLVRQDEKGITVLFLNAAVHIQSMRSLLLVSLAIGLCSLLMVFFLILLFSRRAVRPYMKNIERQKRFITDAGHELKTPITSIATSADIAAMEHEGDEWIENIRRQAARLTRLVGDMVALSRLDEETPFPEKSRFSVSEAAWEIAEPFEVLAKAKGKKYSQRIEDDLTLYGDRGSIQRMISILLDNAVRYSDDGGEIRMQIYRRRSKVCIEVSNTCDLPDVSDLDRLFDRFYRMDESRSAMTGGTGIGLSMVQAIAETHGGKASVQSADGKEICFKVVL
ncbi:MAG: GHKL domain-containing protein [Lachnospiraceae bacterium]|nr:GHKL domain-containing protein [Lachnospiraceae bacterium]